MATLFTRLRVTLAVLLFAWFSMATVEQSSAADGPMERIISLKQRALTDQQVYVPWRKEFLAVSDDELRMLLENEDDSIALTAAWELYVRRPAAQHDPARNTIPKVGADNFLSFCEKRLKGVKLPQWFGEILPTGIARDQAASCHLPENVPGKALADWLFSTDAKNVVLQGDTVQLQTDQAMLAIPVKNLDKHDAGVSFASKDGRFWVADYPFHHQLAGISLTHYEGGVQKWTSKAWASVILIDSSGSSPHIASVVLGGERQAYIIGIGSAGPYVEGFDRDTGAAKMRFLTTFYD